MCIVKLFVGFGALLLKRFHLFAEFLLRFQQSSLIFVEGVKFTTVVPNAIKLRAQFIIRPSRSSSKSEIFHSMGNSQNLCQHFEWNQEFSAISRVCCYTSCQPL